MIGAGRIVDGKPLYGSFSSNNEHGDTYGPVNHEAYIPFEQIFGRTLEDPVAAQAAAIFFDLVATALLFLIGRRLRGPTLGIALAYAWVSYPFTLFALESDVNDSLLAVLVPAAVLAASYPGKLAMAARGALTALAGLTKFAPLALAPVLAAHGLRGLSPVRRARALALYVAAFLGHRRARLHPRVQPRFAARDLRADHRLPGQSQHSVLGVGAVRRTRRFAG